MTTGGGDLYRARSDTYLSGKTLSVPFPPKAVQTLQVDGVTVEDPRHGGRGGAGAAAGGCAR